MIRMLMKCWLVAAGLLSSFSSFSQTQACPVNINFSSGTLSHWLAYTGNNQQGNGDSAIKMRYDTSLPAPQGTLGTRSIPEYQLPSVAGIRTIVSPGADLYGQFPTIPTINGYHYDYSILLGSTSITRSSAQSSTPPGGYIRGVSYVIDVPATPATQPYTMTYAYAMVLENGAHNSNNQPLFSATLKTNNGIIACASPSYYLPTFDNATQGGGHATLDTAAAIKNGFSASRLPSPNPNPNGSGPDAPHLYDVWTKGWTEVTFDLSPYRGQQVTLTFEADNCVPGGHFAYAYVALRNTCAGLLISGDTIACSNTPLTYSIPALAGAAYQWSVPGDWQITSGSGSNIITVNPGSLNGKVIAREQNSCADLADTIQVKSLPPTIPGSLAGDAEVCTGINSTPLTLSGNSGQVLEWLSSTDGGQNWNGEIANTTASYTAQNLTTTTLFKAVVQNGPACSIDSSAPATIRVDAASAGGTLLPASAFICKGQDRPIELVLNQQTGRVVNWQSSQDSVNWQPFSPADHDTSWGVASLSATTYYRTIVQNGVCPADTSAVASLTFLNAAFPQAKIDPADTTICYGGQASLQAVVSIGTQYSWTNTASLSNQGSGQSAVSPFSLLATAAPNSSTEYVLNILNPGCPNLLSDTFEVHVIAPILVNAGNDTAIVVNQPLQLHAYTNDSSANSFNWSPPDGLSNPNIYNPVAVLGSSTDTITYLVRASDSLGCFGQAEVRVRVFKTLPDIFVPNAFTPGKTTNPVFRPIPVGISSLQYFRVYNRWGQLVFATSRLGAGWDGSLGGKPQDTGSYVWMLQGTDYTGKTITHKGTMTLIR